MTGPTSPRAVRPATLPQRLARRVLAAAGWSVDVAPPPGPCGVIIVYPHTSNWDFVVGYAAKVASGLRVRWIGKASLFRPPLGALFRRLGGIPVDRSDPAGLVEALAGELQRSEWLWIALAPEGTRRRTDHLKSGFHRLALAAGVPVGLAFIDWERREVGLRRYVRLSGDDTRDLALVREEYADKRGKHRGQEGALRFRRRAR